jgi:iron-sulfur cluster assembly protein
MITVTEAAAKKVLALAQKEGKPPVLRVGVRGGGCSGVSYFMDFDDKPRDGDESLEAHGVKVVCDPKSLKFIDGTTLDFENKLLGGGFKWDNPRAKKSCGCGESFTI